MIKVYGHPNSRSTRVVWALEEADAAYSYTKVDLFKGEGRKPPYVDLNPAGKVPALVDDDDLVITESAAICTYIAEKFPAAELIPPLDHPRNRAEYFRWCFFALSELEQPLWTIAKHRFALPEDKRVPAIIDTAIWEFSQQTKVLEKHLYEREFAVGNHFTVADILIAHTLAWARSAKVPLGHATLEHYADQMLSRPALHRAKQREQGA